MEKTKRPWRNMLGCALLLGAAALLAASFASAVTSTSTSDGVCATPARGTLDNAMAFEATWTTEAGLSESIRHSTLGELAKTEVEWRAPPWLVSDVPAFGCLVFDVELLLPPAARAYGDGALLATATADAPDVEFAVEIVSHLRTPYAASHHHGESHEYRAVLRVGVRANAASTDYLSNVSTGGHWWYYPVTLRSEGGGGSRQASNLS